MNKNVWYVFAASLALGSCTTTSGYLDRSKLPLVGYEKTAGFAAGNHTGDDDLVVVMRDAKNKLVPASCELQGAGFKSSFVGSSRVNLPLFGRSENPVTVACTLNGQTQTRQATVTNLTLHKIRANEFILKDDCKGSTAPAGNNVAIGASVAASGFCNNLRGSASAELDRLKALSPQDHEYGFTAVNDFVFERI